MRDGTPPPVLSVVVAPTETGASLAACLALLAAQVDPPTMEVIVPVDGSVEGLDDLRARHPDVIFLEVEGTTELALSGDIGTVHEAIDRRRAAALAAARGRIVALTEEHARPRPRWCAGIVAAHESADSVIGGAIANDSPRLVNAALFHVDGGRYQNPVDEGPAVFVSDVNVSYKRDALHAVSDAWAARYHETGVHDALRAAGHTLRLRRDLEIGQDRGRVPLGHALSEKFAWARLYAGRRAGEIGTGRRLVYAALSPLLAGVFLWRQTSLALRRSGDKARFLCCLPLLVAFDVIRAAGEFTGYVTGRASRQR